MGDILYGIDFRNKKRGAPVKTALQEGLETIATGLSLETPPEILLALYESQVGFVNIPVYEAPEKDPA